MADPLAKVAIPEEPAARPRRFALAALAATALLLVATLALNVYVDPRGDFPGQRYTPLVEDVPREKLRLYRAFHEEGPADAVVVGSSRAMPLPPGATGAGRAFNFAILGGSLHDGRLAYDLVRREQAAAGEPAPRLLVVVLDSFQLMDLPDGRRWSEVLGSRSAPAYLGEPTPLSSYAGPLRDALSAAYVEDSLRALRYTHVSGYPEPANGFLPDGQGTRPRVDPAVAAGSHDLDAAFEANWDRYLGRIYAEDSHPSQAQADDLRGLVRAARDDGAEVWIVLPPFLDEALERLEGIAGFRRVHDAALAESVALCEPGGGVAVFDYTRAASFGGDPSGFYDGYHVTPANGATMLAAARAGHGDLCGAA